SPGAEDHPRLRQGVPDRPGLARGPARPRGARTRDARAPAADARRPPGPPGRMTVRVSGPPLRPGGPVPDRQRLARGGRAVLRALGHAGSELSLALVDDEAIAALNERDRGKAGPTDVLSYSLLEGPHSDRRGALLGDVVISVDTAARQARARR